MTGSSPVTPSIVETAILLGASRKVGGPLGATVELCILTTCLPFEAVQLDVAGIDRVNGGARVQTRRGNDAKGRRVIALPPPAMEAVRRIAGSARHKGQVVTGGQGEPLAAKYVRLDRICDLFARTAPETIRIYWNFFGIRALALELFRNHGLEREGEYALGRNQRPKTPVSEMRQIGMANAALAVWHQALREAADAARG